MFRSLVFLCFVFFATEASAELGAWTYCGGGASTNSVVRTSECKQRIFNNAGTNNEGFSVRVQDGTALISFQSDRLAATGSAVVQLKKCLAGYLPSDDANAALSCTDLTNSNWDGSGGAGGTQLFAERVGPGLYWIEIVTAAGAGDEAIIQVQGD